MVRHCRTNFGAIPVKEKGAGRLVCSDHKVVYETVRIRERGISRQRTFYMCETILKDGELTYDELYKIAEWLIENREAYTVGQPICLWRRQRHGPTAKSPRLMFAVNACVAAFQRPHRDPGSGLLE